MRDGATVSTVKRHVMLTRLLKTLRLVPLKRTTWLPSPSGPVLSVTRSPSRVTPDAGVPSTVIATSRRWSRPGILTLTVTVESLREGARRGRHGRDARRRDELVRREGRERQHDGERDVEVAMSGETGCHGSSIGNGKVAAKDTGCISLDARPLRLVVREGNRAHAPKGSTWRTPHCVVFSTTSPPGVARSTRSSPTSSATA